MAVEALSARLDSVESVDRERRARNAFIIAVGLTALDAAGIVAYAVAGFASDVLPILSAVVVAHAGAALAARRGAPTWSGVVLVLVSLASIAVGTAVSGHAAGGFPFLFAPVAIAAATLPWLGVLATAIATGLAALSFLAFAPGPVEAVDVGLLVVSGVVAAVAAGIIGVVQTRTARAFIGLAHERERIVQQAEASKAVTEDRYRLVVDGTNDLVALLDASGTWLYASPSFQRVLGHDPEAFTGTRRDDFTPDDDKPRQYAAVEFAWHRGEARANLRLRSSDGTTRPFDVAYRRVDGPAGPLLAFSARDVTDQLELVAQLEQAQKLDALGLLASSIAHDFNNLLTVISVSASDARADLPADHPSQGSLEAILTTTDSAVGLTRQLLAFSRGRSPEKEVVAVTPTLRDFAALARRLLGGRVTLSLAVEEDAGRYFGTRSQLEQVVMNLVVNARDAMPDGGRIVLAARRVSLSEPPAGLSPGPFVEVRVTDEGTGMDEATRSRVFDPFFTTKGTGRGTGLGLSTSAAIARALGGHLAVDSTPGKGSTFTLHLPLHEGEP